MNKTAIVVIHGMGNQYPMETITNFVDNLFEGKTYSAPERITESYDHRKIVAYNENEKYDCYEYYWAHMITEPTILETLGWIFNLLFIKEPSDRFKFIGFFIRLIFLLFISLFVFSVYLYYYFLVYEFIHYDTYLQFCYLLLPLLTYVFIKSIIKKLMYSFGDVIRYTLPHPKNLSIRQKISKSAVEFLTKLHDKEFGYDRIVIVGHSLGSIVSYEMIINTFGHINKKFRNASGINKELADEINNLNKPNQRLEKLGVNFEWKVSDFITCGSPLCHAHMILVKNEEMFNKKVDNGEYPVCPPKQENLFYSGNNKSKIYPKHDSVFGFVHWTNIFFTNDYIGGYLKNLFGGDIMEHKISPNHFNGLLKSHSHYWNKEKEKSSFEIIKNIIFNKS